MSNDRIQQYKLQLIQSMNIFKFSTALLLILLAFSFVGCDKPPDCGLEPLATRNACDLPTSADGFSPRELILNYLDENNISAEETDTGLFYTIINEGNGNKPILGNTVVVDYSGYFRNGCSFDSGSTDFNLVDLVTGWQQGVPLIGVCGTIQLFLIPELGFEARFPDDFPTTEPIMFDINLLDFE